MMINGINLRRKFLSNLIMRTILQPGEKVMILPTVKEEDLPKLFPGGVDRVSMPSGKVYVRTTTNY